jgi:hypothetical protein
MNNTPAAIDFDELRQQGQEARRDLGVPEIDN